MYKRLTQEHIDSIKCEQQIDRLFINLYQAVGSVGLNLDDITPEEIWEEATLQVRNIASSQARDFSINTLYTTLCHKYLDYQDTTGKIIHRKTTQAQNTTFLVELVILYQLTIYQRGWTNHPYKDFCLTIHKHISSNPLFIEILPQITASNDEYEKVFLSEIPTHDYMPQVVKEDSVIREALQCSYNCAKYLANGYTKLWLANFWTALIQSKHKEQLISELTSDTQQYTTIYKIIGLLLEHKVFNATQKQLAQTSTLIKPTKDTMRRYISAGYNNDTNYDKFVKQYVNQK